MNSAVNMRIKAPAEVHNGYTIYNDVDTFRGKVFRKVKKSYIYDNHQKIIRVCAGFDIETTRVNERAYMYHWQFSFDKNVLCGRKWSDFAKLVEYLNTWLSWQKAIIIVWVANLGHEFSFMCSRFKWSSIFAIAPHEPLKARTNRVEFRECLSISGQGGLANLAKNYTTTKKAKGDLDYTISRNSQTELTETEKGYCYADVEILSEWGTYIFENFSDKNLQIPLTATGIVRSHIRQAAEETGRFDDIKKAIWHLFPQDRKQYNYIMSSLFRGGYTHACCWYSTVLELHVIGADYTSSYPAVMLHCSNYQRTPFVKTDLQTDGKHIIDERMQTMCVWFVARIKGIEQTTKHAIESKHKLDKFVNAEFDNGRLRSADEIVVALTEIDYEIYTLFYDWESIEILDAQTAQKGKLPEYVLKPLRHFYKIKSRLKKAKLDGTIEYVNAKAICNSMYGCCVTRLKFIESKYNQDTKQWEDSEQDKTYDELRKNQILSPYWGIQITANARAALLKTVFKLDGQAAFPNVLYCDTDSIYMKNTKENRAIIEEYNKAIFEMNKEYEPEFFDIGAFDWIDKDENGNPIEYMFKTLGAKRYLKYHDGIAEVTVSGLPKGTLERQIAKPFAYSDDCYIAYEDRKHKKGRIGFVSVSELFAAFNDHMLLSCSVSHKTRSVYYPCKYDQWEGDRRDIVTDLQGHSEEMTESSYVAIVPIDFKLHMEQGYMDLIELMLKERRLPV